MKYILLLLILITTASAVQAQDSTASAFGGGFALYPLPSRTLLGYRGNATKNWSFDSKFGYTFTAAPQFNIEVGMLHRHIKNEIFNIYSGFGFTLDGFTPGCIVPVGFEWQPLPQHKNLRVILEASPKFTFSFSSGIYSTLFGNIGFIYYRPAKK